MKKQANTFVRLVENIRDINNNLVLYAGRTVDISTTVRNWFIGFYIVEYEQKGTDRAHYGEKLLDSLSKELTENGVNGVSSRSLRLYRKFYSTYPLIWQTVSAKSFLNALPAGIWQTMSAKSKAYEVRNPAIRLESARTSSDSSELIQKLCFSHFVELIEIDDKTKRVFYEKECMKGNWSVRELQRQINSLYYERSWLSTNKKKLSSITESKAAKYDPRLAIRDPYVFEFLGLKPKEAVKESDLESALLDKLQEFLLELGYGFCFEARQKRINIGGEYCFVDLVFYHRVLKCHVLVELKADKFKHENISQLNTYVNWYKKCEMTKGDNPPIGILLCTHKNHEMVEFALAGMDNKLFVKKYQLELPKKKEIMKFVEEQF